MESECSSFSILSVSVLRQILRFTLSVSLECFDPEALQPTTTCFTHPAFLHLTEWFGTGQKGDQFIAKGGVFFFIDINFRSSQITSIGT